MLANRDVSLLAKTDSSFEIHCDATVFGLEGDCSGRETALLSLGRSIVWGLMVSIVKLMREFKEVLDSMKRRKK